MALTAVYLLSFISKGGSTRRMKITLKRKKEKELILVARSSIAIKLETTKPSKVTNMLILSLLLRTMLTLSLLLRTMLILSLLLRTMMILSLLLRTMLILSLLLRTMLILSLLLRTMLILSLLLRTMLLMILSIMLRLISILTLITKWKHFFVKEIFIVPKLRLIGLITAMISIN